MYHIALAKQAGSKLDDALKAQTDAKAAYEELHDSTGAAGCMIMNAEIRLLQGQHEDAVKVGEEAMAVAKKLALEGLVIRADAVVQKAREKIIQSQPVFQPTFAAGQTTTVVYTTAAAAAPVPRGPDPAEIEKLVFEVAYDSGIDGTIDKDTILTDAGLDSLSSVGFRNGLAKALGIKLPASLVFDYPTVRQIVEMVIEEIGVPEPPPPAQIATTVVQNTPGVPVAAAAPAVPEKPKVDPAVVEALVFEVAADTGVEGGLELDTPLTDAGLDSLSSVAFRNTLQTKVGFKLAASLVFDYTTVRQVTAFLVEEMTARGMAFP